MNLHRLRPLFQPASVAIVGISPQRTHGMNVLSNLRKRNFAGDVFAVHPKITQIGDMPVYAGLEALPRVPECVVIALGADKVVEQVALAGKLGVRAAVVFASGFAELSDEGKALEARLASTAADYGIQLCGPNCMGLADFSSGFSAYSGALPNTAANGSVAALSHSGSGCVVLGNTGRFGLSRLVSVGNGACLDMADYLDYLAHDDETRVASLLIETVRNPDAFRQATAAMHAAGKHVVALKNGRSQRGAAATAAHTGALAGGHAAYDEFFRACGVITVGDLDELVEVTALLDGLKAMPRPGGAAIIGISGGETAMACDLAEEAALPIAELAPATNQAIESAMPKFSYASNPLDARTLDSAAYERLILALAADPGVSLVAVAQDSSETLDTQQAQTYRAIAEAAQRASTATATPIVFYNPTVSAIHPLIAEPLLAAGIPMLRGARNSIVAVAKVLSHINRPIVAATRANDRPVLAADPRWLKRLQEPAAFTEREAKEFLAACGLPIPVERLARTAAQAVSVALTVGWPVALKIDSPDIQHKTEVGGVALSLGNAGEVEAAFERIVASAKKLAPHAHINGVLVQEMVSAGVEVIVGLSRQPPFNTAITVGWGGVLVELMQDSRMLLLPTTAPDVRSKLSETRVSQLLAGYRAGPAADTDALVGLILQVGDIAATYGHLIEALDLNPVSVLSAGRGVRVLDALLITRPS